MTSTFRPVINVELTRPRLKSYFHPESRQIWTALPWELRCSFRVDDYSAESNTTLNHESDMRQLP